MRLRVGVGIAASVVALVLIGFLAYLAVADVAVLDPKGMIADQQKQLLIIATLLMLIVVLPVFFLTFFIAWRYRANNRRADYRPDWDHDKRLEAVWWGVPLIIIVVLSIITWVTTHKLDPYRALESDQPPVKVQVVALQWKWLFIYPEYDVASVNYLRVPEDRPINFDITADAPMNSFWVPQLGGQVYAMNGMNTKLHLIADEPGVYQGVSANISGEGFADMRFEVEAVPPGDFQRWIDDQQLSSQPLDEMTYHQLAEPASQPEPIQYHPVDDELYATILDKYMAADKTSHQTNHGVEE